MRTEADSNPTAGRRGIGAVATALAAAVTLSLAPGAAAKPQPVGAGTTTLKVNAAMGEFLADTGTKLRTIKPAKEKKAGVQLPITKGKLDTKKVKGQVRHDGGFELRGRGGKAKLTAFVARFAKAAELSAKVGKKNTPLFALDTANAKAKKKGSAVRITGVRVMLAPKGVALIERITEMELEDREVVFGKLKVNAEPGDIVLRSGNGTLTLHDSALQAFADAGISVSAVEPATAKPNGSFAFPVLKGKIGADGTSGNVRLDGALGLTEGATSLDWLKPRISLSKGEVRARGPEGAIAALAFDAAKLKVAQKKKRVTVSRIRTALGAEGASAINEAFGTNAFSEGQQFGTFEVKGKTAKGGGGGKKDGKDEKPEEGEES